VTSVASSSSLLLSSMPRARSSGFGFFFSCAHRDGFAECYHTGSGPIVNFCQIARKISTFLQQKLPKWLKYTPRPGAVGWARRVLPLGAGRKRRGVHPTPGEKGTMGEVCLKNGARQGQDLALTVLFVPNSHPKPSTLNPEPQTLNPTPQTLNPKH